MAKPLIRLRICTGWYEPLLVAHTTLLEISCRGSYVSVIFFQYTYLLTNQLESQRLFFEEKIDVIEKVAFEKVNSGFKLGPDSREKWLLPPVILGRSDCQIGRSYSIKLRHFLSVKKQISYYTYYQH